jgi:hypothetical protein
MNKFLQHVATENANGEIWPSQFDVLAKTTEIARLLKRLSAGKRHAFDSLAGKDPLGDFLHGLFAIRIKSMARWVKATAATQITSLEPYHCSVSRAVDRAQRQHRMDQHRFLLHWALSRRAFYIYAYRAGWPTWASRFR